MPHQTGSWRSSYTILSARRLVLSCHDNTHAWRVDLCFPARMARRAAQTIISILVAFT